MVPRFRKRLLPAIVLPGLLLVPGLAGAEATSGGTVPAGAGQVAQAPQSAAGRAELIEARNAVAERPDDADARVRLGTLSLELGDAAGAEKELSRAIELGADDFPTRMLRAKAQLAQGNFDAVAMDRDLKSGDTAEDRAAARVLQGLARLAMNQAQGARNEFEEALAEVPRYSPALVGLARVKLDARDLGAAEQAVRDAAAGVASDELALAELRGDLAMAQERYDDAARAYGEVLQQQPNRLPMIRALAAAQIGQGRPDEARVNLKRVLEAAPEDRGSLYYEALLDYRDKDYARAAERLDRVLAGAMVDPASLRLAGLVAYQLKNLQQAREHLTTYHGLEPGDTAAAQVLGMILIQQGDADAAYRVLKPLVDAQTKDTELLANAGAAALLAGKHDEGLGFLKRAQALAPGNPGIEARLAVAEAASGQRGQGLAELERLIKSDPRLAELAVPLAADLLANGDFARAQVLAGRLRQANPQDPRPWVIQGIAEVGAGKLDEARASFQKAVAIDPDDLDAQTGLADVQYRSGDAAGALARLQALLASRPGERRVLVNLAGIETATGQGERAARRLSEALAEAPGDPELSVALAALQLEQFRLKEALETLGGVAAMAADRPDLLAVRGRAELAGARRESALVTLKRLVETNPMLPEGHRLLALAYAAAGDRPAARKEVAAAQALAPDDPYIRITALRIDLGDRGAGKDQVAAAVKSLQQLAAAHPKDPRVGELRGLVLARAGQAAEGLKLLRTAQSVLKTSDSVQSLADVLDETGHQDEAVAVLRDWLTAYPEDANVRVRLAKLEVVQRNYRAAADDLARAVEQQAEGIELRTALAWTLALAGRTDEAAPLAQEALRRSAKDPLAAHAMALVYLRRDQPAQAVEVMRPAMATGEPRAVRMQLDYARALAGTRDLPGARAALKRALETAAPNSPEYAEAKSMLAGLPQ